MAAWDDYIDNLRSHSKKNPTDSDSEIHCERACIIGLVGGAPWTSAGHAHALKLVGSEGATIANCLQSKDFGPFQSSGIMVEGVKFQFLREEDNRIVFGKKKDHGSITIQASKTAIVIGFCNDKQQHGNLNKGVGVIAEYLESMGM